MLVKTVSCEINFTYLFHFKQQNLSASVKFFIKYFCQTLIEYAMTLIVVPQFT